MNRLIKLQIRNVFHNKLFYVCLGLTLFLSPVITFISKLSLTSSNSLKVFPQITGFLATQVDIVSVIFIALFCCYDFNEGTTKNIIARGYNKVQLLFSKYIVTLMGILLMYIITVLVTVILFANNGFGFESNMIYLLIVDVFKIVAFVIFYATMSIVLEKNGSAILACLFVPSVISLILGVLDANLNLDIAKYWIENLSNNFIQNPTLGNLGWPIIGYIIYIVVSITIGLQILKKKEIK